jgi:2-hydroxychromene-2-carboxylate isomerase
VPVEWVPVALGTPEEGLRCAAELDAYREDVERRAAARGLQAVRWPPDWPFDSAFAQRVATFAKQGGKTVQFALAAFRQAYAGGADLSKPEAVLIAAAACELHPRAVLSAAATAGVARRLEAAAAEARDRGVRSAPAVFVPGAGAFHGDDALEDAVRALKEV